MTKTFSKKTAKIKQTLQSYPREFWIGFFSLTVIMLFFHFILIDTNWGDEVKFRKLLKKENYDIGSIVINRWSKWTSRLGVEYIMFLFCKTPQIVWKIVDCTIILTLYTIVCRYTKQYIPAMLLMASYPFVHLASAGWIATTTNYLWPFFAMILCIHILLTLSRKFNIYLCALYFLLLFYFMFSEIMSAVYICILFMLFFEKKLSAKNNIMFFASLAVITLGISNHLFCPGNSIRTDREIQKWMPEFPDLTMFSRFRICAVSTLQHYTSIPNILFFVFNGLLIYCVWNTTTKKTKRIISLLPMLINIISTGYYTYFEIIKKRSVDYVEPQVIIVQGTKEYWLQIFLLILALVYFVSSIYSIYTFFYQTSFQKAIRYCFVFAIGMGTRFFLMFSPTMLASSTRMYFVCYVAMMWISLNMLSDKKAKKLNKYLYVILIVGIILNTAMIVMLQRKYS